MLHLFPRIYLSTINHRWWRTEGLSKLSHRWCCSLGYSCLALYNPSSVRDLGGLGSWPWPPFWEGWAWGWIWGSRIQLPTLISDTTLRVQIKAIGGLQPTLVHPLNSLLHQVHLVLNHFHGSTVTGAILHSENRSIQLNSYHSNLKKGTSH